MAKITGHCLCGKVSYTATEDPVFQGVCHCKDCQRQGGTAFAVVAAFLEPAITFSGEMKTYTAIGDSGGEVRRSFCPDCGSGVVSRPSSSPGMAFVKAGTLDDTSILAPVVHIYCDSKMPWLTLPEGAMTFPKSPN